MVMKKGKDVGYNKDHLFGLELGCCSYSTCTPDTPMLYYLFSLVERRQGTLSGVMTRTDLTNLSPVAFIAFFLLKRANFSISAKRTNF